MDLFIYCFCDDAKPKRTETANSDAWLHFSLSGFLTFLVRIVKIIFASFRSVDMILFRLLLHSVWQRGGATKGRLADAQFPSRSRRSQQIRTEICQKVKLWPVRFAFNRKTSESKNKLSICMHQIVIHPIFFFLSLWIFCAIFRCSSKLLRIAWRMHSPSMQICFIFIVIITVSKIFRINQANICTEPNQLAAVMLIRLVSITTFGWQNC